MALASSASIDVPIYRKLRAKGQMAEVTYCKYSTITEAWAVVLGLPAEVNDAEGKALLYAGQKKFKGLSETPSLVFVQQQEGPTPPFWNHQLQWDSGNGMARIGHRYLSTHFLRQGERKYERYEISLQPYVDDWLRVFNETLTGSESEHLVDRIGFGYVNTFQFESAGFDLQRYFKIQLGLGVQASNNGALGADASFRLFDEDSKCELIVSLFVDATSGDTLHVRTKVAADMRGLSDISFLQSDEVSEKIRHAKAVAKRTFFDFAQLETHKRMGAEYASG